VAFVIALITIVLIISSDQLVYFVLGRVDKEGLESSSRLPRQIAEFWNAILASDRQYDLERITAQSPRMKRLVWPIAIAIVAVGGFQFVRFMALPASERVLASDNAAAFEKEDFAVDSEKWKPLDFAEQERHPQSSLGQYSSGWSYLYDGRPANFAILRSTNNGIDTQNNMTSIGWSVVDKQDIQQAQNSGERTLTYSIFRLTKPSGEKAILLASAFDKTGNSRWPRLDELGWFPSWLNQKGSQYLSNLLFSPDCNQAQLLVRYFTDLSEDEQSELKNRFVEFHDFAIANLSAGEQGSNPVAAH
jgi:hypothetical protein